MSDQIVDAPIPELSAQDRLNALTPEARSTWDLTGEWPDPAKVTTTAEDDDDEPEPVVPPATETPAPAPVQEPAPAEAGKLAAERRTGKQTRQQQINELIRKTTESDLRARALEAEIQALKAPKAEPAAKAETKDEFQPTRPRPVEADFETYPDFTEALADWKFDQREAKAKFETEKSERERTAAEQHESDRARVVSWVERRDKFAAETPAFTDAAVQTFLGTLRTGTPTGDAIADSDVGPQMALYLAQHPDEADRIARLAPGPALRALGKIEAKFDSTDTLTSASASAGPAAKTVTTAPAPPTTLAARTSTPAGIVLERDGYVAWEAEENRRATSASR